MRLNLRHVSLIKLINSDSKLYFLKNLVKRNHGILPLIYYSQGWSEGSVVEALTALPEDSGSIPSTQSAVHNCL